MKWWLIGVLAVSVGVAAAQHEPYPGQGEHKEPPAGWTCSRDGGGNFDHICNCRGMSEQKDPMCKTPEKPADPNPPDEGGDNVTQGEDPSCTVFCHRSHCACPIRCDS